jgi:hypothetical protein
MINAWTKFLQPNLWLTHDEPTNQVFKTNLWLTHDEPTNQVFKTNLCLTHDELNPWTELLNQSYVF